MGPLAGISALVTGGGSGIGFACATRLAADGALLTLAGRTESRLDAAVQELRKLHPECEAVYAVAENDVAGFHAACSGV